jgi:S-adenosylmethionine hydrolase
VQIITLTSDLGWKDYYVGKLKGSLLSHGIAALLVDITHDINNFDIAHGAFVLKNCYESFPKGTIHILSVHNFYSEGQRRFLAIMQGGHYFIGADNGQFSLLFDGNIPERCYELPELGANEPYTAIDGVLQVFSRAAGHLLRNLAFDTIGTPNNWILQRINIQPIIGKHHIRGAVAHVDKYDNVILNIDRHLFERVGRGRRFELYYRRFDPISEIHAHYAEVPIGDVVCIFNSAGLLEIAIHLDRAATLLGLKADDAVQIDFFD